MASFTLEREIAAPPETVFEILVDHRGYAAITPLRKVELEREGDPAPNGVGAIRVLHSVGPPLREEILTYEEPSRYSYKLLSGLPVRDHVGTIELTPEDGRTQLTYAVRTMPTVPLVGSVVVGAIRLGVKQLLSGVAGEAERRASSAPNG
jgi:uncharacterized protein YndB with AHSA1/START domain